MREICTAGSAGGAGRKLPASTLHALCGIVREHMHSNVLQGGVYIFINTRRNQIKLLEWEGDGLAIYYKRLEKGVFELPCVSGDATSVSIDAVKLQLILQGIVLGSVKKKVRFSFP